MLTNIINHPYTWIIFQFILFIGLLLGFAFFLVYFLYKVKAPEWLIKPLITLSLLGSMILILSILR